VKVAFVVQRYGAEVSGGSELHCRQIAERLAARHDVVVYTSCAKDYQTWRNEYPAGRSRVGPLEVVRFPVAEERDLVAFNRLSEQVFTATNSDEREQEWLRKQGPFVPQLVRHLGKHYKEHDAFIFFTLLYFPCVKGLEAVPWRRILVPTAHDEPALRLRLFEEALARPEAILYNSPWEERFLRRRCERLRARGELAGVGVELPSAPPPAPPVTGEYVLAGGRIEPGKGFAELLDFFHGYRAAAGDPVQLVLIGQQLMPLPDDPEILYLGYVAEEIKHSLLAHARAVLVPSPFESLSMLLLEAFAHRRPVLVNAACEVLVDHCVRSGGGLFYADGEEFRLALKRILSDRELAAAMGQGGFAYVSQHYTWQRIESVYERTLSALGPVPG